MPFKRAKEYITKKEFARRMGISNYAVVMAIKSGRIIPEDRGTGKEYLEWYSSRERFINLSKRPDVTRQAVSEYGDSLKTSDVRATPANNRKIKATKVNSHPLDSVQDPPDTDGDFHPQMNRFEAESVKQVYLAKQAKLKFLKEAGLLVEAQTVKREWEEIAVRVQKAMLAIPDRVSEIFASINDADKIHKYLEAEIRHALSSLQYSMKSEEKHDRIKKIVEEETEGEVENSEAQDQE